MKKIILTFAILSFITFFPNVSMAENESNARYIELREKYDEIRHEEKVYKRLLWFYNDKGNSEKVNEVTDILYNIELESVKILNELHLDYPNIEDNLDSYEPNPATEKELKEIEPNYKTKEKLIDYFYNFIILVGTITIGINLFKKKQRGQK